MTNTAITSQKLEVLDVFGDFGLSKRESTAANGFCGGDDAAKASAVRDTEVLEGSFFSFSGRRRRLRQRTPRRRSCLQQQTARQTQQTCRRQKGAMPLWVHFGAAVQPHKSSLAPANMPPPSPCGERHLPAPVCQASVSDVKLVLAIAPPHRFSCRRLGPPPSGASRQTLIRRHEWCR